MGVIANFLIINNVSTARDVARTCWVLFLAKIIQLVATNEEVGSRKCGYRPKSSDNQNAKLELH